MVRIDELYFRQALSFYDQRRDKTWGLVDCASFVVMQNLGVSQVMTLDHHYEQAGFRPLLGRGDRANGSR